LNVREFDILKVLLDQSPPSKSGKFIESLIRAAFPESDAEYHSGVIHGQHLTAS
jgi:hypothetical protein